MAKTPSTMVSLGTQAKDFTLPDTVSGETVSLSDIASDVATVIMFICNHCPFVVHIHSELVKLPADYADKGVSFVAVSSNDVANYPQDSPEKMKELFEGLGIKFPYLYDESQDVAKAYDAACTPDFFVYDGNRKLAYRGQLDASRPGNGVPVDGRDIRSALDALIAGEQVPSDQTPSIGCNIKWR
jgi:peroxiredoxin